MIFLEGPSDLFFSGPIPAPHTPAHPGSLGGSPIQSSGSVGGSGVLV